MYGSMTLPEGAVVATAVPESRAGCGQFRNAPWMKKSESRGSQVAELRALLSASDQESLWNQRLLVVLVNSRGRHFLKHPTFFASPNSVRNTESRAQHSSGLCEREKKRLLDESALRDERTLSEPSARDSQLRSRSQLSIRDVSRVPTHSRVPWLSRTRCVVTRLRHKSPPTLKNGKILSRRATLAASLDKTRRERRVPTIPSIILRSVCGSGVRLSVRGSRGYVWSVCWRRRPVLECVGNCPRSESRLETRLETRSGTVREARRRRARRVARGERGAREQYLLALRDRQGRNRAQRPRDRAALCRGLTHDAASRAAVYIENPTFGF